MNEQSFLTVSKSATCEIIEKKSRFIGYISRCDSEEQSLEFINSIKTQNWEAKHNVYAYSIDKDGCNNIMRFSDDGEPQGTAGMPVLQVIKNRDIHNVVIVITRYFGGILLGASGLLRAYGKCASMVVDEAGLSELVLCVPITFSFDYSFFGIIQRSLENKGFIVETPVFDEKVSITYIVPFSKIDDTIVLVTNLTSAKFTYILGDKGYWEM